MKDPRDTLRKALESAEFLISEDPNLKGADTLDLIEHDLHAAKVALEALLDARALAEDEDNDP
jgi:hypothetical protein